MGKWILHTAITLLAVLGRVLILVLTIPLWP